MDLIQLLKKDHKAVKHLFEEFEKLSGRSAQKKQTIVAQIRQALGAHMRVEEEIVYPVFKKEVRLQDMKDQVSEADEEHHVAKTLLSELAELRPDDERYDAKVTVLGEYIMHHVKEEEKEMFPQAQKRLSGKRLEELGTAVEARRQELVDEAEVGRRAA